MWICRPLKYWYGYENDLMHLTILLYRKNDGSGNDKITSVASIGIEINEKSQLNSLIVDNCGYW